MAVGTTEDVDEADAVAGGASPDEESLAAVQAGASYVAAAGE